MRMIKMKMKKTIIITIIVILLSFTSLSHADAPPMPGLPQMFWGNVNYTTGENLEDGSIVRAFVDDENYTTNVVNGTYGYYTPFYVEDNENDNFGKNISFYVNGVFTGTTVVFDPGTVNLNLTITKDEENGNDGGSTGTGGGGATNNLISPVANINIPIVGFVNRSVKINASGSTDYDGQIVLYSWNFGDDSALGSGFEVFHTYQLVGNYTVNLMVKDDDDLTDTAESIIKIMIDSDSDDWGDSEEEKYDTDPHNDSDYPYDTDGDRIPDSFDSDDDNDGLSDYYEGLLGLDPLFSYDVLNISKYLESGFLLDIDCDDLYDLYFDMSQNKSSQVEYEKDAVCLIDTNFDGNFDYRYDIQSDSIDSVNNSTVIFYFIGVVLVALILILGLIYKKRNRSRKK